LPRPLSIAECRCGEAIAAFVAQPEYGQEADQAGARDRWLRRSGIRRSKGGRGSTSGATGLRALSGTWEDLRRCNARRIAASGRGGNGCPRDCCSTPERKWGRSLKSWSHDVTRTYFAVGANHGPIVEMLLDRGADATAALGKCRMGGQVGLGAARPGSGSETGSRHGQCKPLPERPDSLGTEFRE